jgi:putative tricarboxylic transport membrane protein
MNIDKLSGGLIALLGLILLYLVIPYQVEIIESDGLTPRTFPDVLACLLVIAGFVQLIASKKSDVKIDKELANVAILCGLLAGFIYLASLFHFIYISPILAFVLMRIMKEKRLFWLGLGTVCTPFFLWLCVEVLLGRELI